MGKQTDAVTLTDVAMKLGYLSGLVESQHDFMKKFDARVFGDSEQTGEIPVLKQHLEKLERRILYIGSFFTGSLVAGVILLGKPELVKTIIHLL